MLDAIELPDPSVEITLGGRGGTRKVIWMLPDTGSTGTMIPAELSRDLQLTRVGALPITGVGGKVSAAIFLLPQMLLGAVIVERLPVAALTLSGEFHDAGVLGMSVLDMAPWEISWDRGTITLNATPWPVGGEVRSWPLMRGADRDDFVDVRVNGFPIRMVLDTGSTSSMIPKDIAARAGLVPDHMSEMRLMHAAGVSPLRPVLVADLEIGSSKLQKQFFQQVETGEDALLGLDALTSYELQIIPGSRLLAKPRNPDMRATAAARVRRWPWMPSCRVVGCVRGYVEGNGEGGRIIFEFEAALPRGAELLFGCADGDDADWVIPRGLIAKEEPPFRHVVLLTNRGATQLFWVPNVDQQLVRANGKPCRELTVLDVAPLRQSELGRTVSRAVLRP